jgi:hypothetical protein
MAYYLDTFIEPESYYEEPEYYVDEEFLGWKDIKKAAGTVSKGVVKVAAVTPVGYLAAKSGALGQTGKDAAKSTEKTLGTIGKGVYKGAKTVVENKEVKKIGSAVGKGLVTAAAVTPVGYVAAKSGVLGQTGKDAAKKAEKVYITVGKGALKGATTVGNVAIKGVKEVSGIAVKGVKEVGGIAVKGVKGVGGITGKLSKGIFGAFDNLFVYIIMFAIIAAFSFIGMPLYGLFGAAGYYGYNTFLKPKPQSNYYDNTEEFISLY